MERETLAASNDADKAWEAAVVYYIAAEAKGNADAAYKRALHRYRSGLSLEVGYESHLWKAAKKRHKKALIDYVYNYDEFKVRTITRSAWKTQRQQQCRLFKCCKYLSSGDCPDTYARWTLGTCYIDGVKAKKNIRKGVEIRDRVLEIGEIDEASRHRMIASQEYYKSLIR